MTDRRDAFPLSWPRGWPRTPPHKRKSASYQVSQERARKELMHELNLLRARHIVLSTNIPLRKDGAPFVAASYQQPSDPGVALYFTDPKGNARSLACDRWSSVRDNLRAIWYTLSSLRQLRAVPLYYPGPVPKWLLEQPRRFPTFEDAVYSAAFEMAARLFEYVKIFPETEYTYDWHVEAGAFGKTYVGSAMQCQDAFLELLANFRSPTDGWLNAEYLNERICASEEVKIHPDGLVSPFLENADAARQFLRTCSTAAFEEGFRSLSSHNDVCDWAAVARVIDYGTEGDES